MAYSNLSVNRFVAGRPESADPFAMQLALSRVHARLVPMRRGDAEYEVDPSCQGWFELPAGRGFAGYGLGRALRMLLDVLRGLTALHDTFDAAGDPFAHGEVALPQFRVDMDGVCRVVPLTARHATPNGLAPMGETLGHLAPERLLGEKVDARADVFSAGVLLWEAMAGRRLFEETTVDAIIDRLMGEKLQMPQLPPELAWAIPLKSVAARALAVDPYQRFADCAELATAIAIVSRDRVATHTEIANFFGAPPRSVERRTREGSSVTPTPTQRLAPSQSSTFPSVDAPASSRRTSTLAPLGPSRSLTPAPVSLRPAEVSARATTHKSPFSVLIGADARTGAGPSVNPLRSNTLNTLGTPESVVMPLPPSVEAAPESTGAPRSSRRPPPLPAWAQVPGMPTPPSVQTSTPAAVLSPMPEPAPIAATVAAELVSLRRPTRHVWGVLAVLALGAAIAAVAVSGGQASPSPTAPPVVAKPIVAHLEAAPLTADHATAVPTPAGAPLAAPTTAPTPVVKEARPPAHPTTGGGRPIAPTKPEAHDYGI